MKSALLKTARQVKRGFTLVEIAIVLVIIGLLIGGVLRGQELINTARVRSLIAEQTSVQTAYYGFLDRFKALPGNLTEAQAGLVGTTARWAGTTGYTSGTIPLTDSVSFFNNITVAGFITCQQCVTPTGVDNATGGRSVSVNSPTNTFGGTKSFNLLPTQAGSLAESTTTFFMTATANELGKPMLTTGSNVASNMLAEIDRKADDGTPATGTFRATNITNPNAAGSFPAAVTAGACAIAAVAGTSPGGTWNINPVANNCQGASFF